MKTGIRMKIFAFALIISLVSALTVQMANANNYLDTQYGPNGIPVHLLKASVSNNVLTIAIMFDNSEGSYLTIKSMEIGNVHYTTADKKFPVLKDTEGNYLASSYSGKEESGYLFVLKYSNGITRFTISKGAKEVAWVKFEAPDENDWPIEVAIPGVTPFTIENPAK